MLVCGGGGSACTHGEDQLLLSHLVNMKVHGCLCWAFTNRCVREGAFCLAEWSSLSWVAQKTMCSGALAVQRCLSQVHLFWSIRGPTGVHPDQLACCQATKQSLTNKLFDQKWIQQWMRERIPWLLGEAGMRGHLFIVVAINNIFFTFFWEAFKNRMYFWRQCFWFQNWLANKLLRNHLLTCQSNSPGFCSCFRCTEN